MHVSFHIVRNAMFTLVLGLDLLVTSAAAACLSPAESRDALASGQVMPLSHALRQAGIDGRPVGAPRLCEGGDSYFYQVKVLGPDGDVTTVDIPAG